MEPYYPAGSRLPGSITFPGLQPEPDRNKALYKGYYGIGDWQPRLGIAYTPRFLRQEGSPRRVYRIRLPRRNR